MSLVLATVFVELAPLPPKAQVLIAPPYVRALQGVSQEELNDR